MRTIIITYFVIFSVITCLSQVDNLRARVKPNSKSDTVEANVLNFIRENQRANKSNGFRTSKGNVSVVVRKEDSVALLNSVKKFIKLSILDSRRNLKIDSTLNRKMKIK